MLPVYLGQWKAPNCSCFFLSSKLASLKSFVLIVSVTRGIVDACLKFRDSVRWLTGVCVCVHSCLAHVDVNTDVCGCKREVLHSMRTSTRSREGETVCV